MLRSCAWEIIRESDYNSVNTNKLFPERRFPLFQFLRLKNPLRPLFGERFNPDFIEVM